MRVSRLLWAGGAAVLLLAGACAHRAGPPARAATTGPAAVPGTRERGFASWYGEPYHGRRTASGEVYDMYGVSAAHRTLPFGTLVRVTRRDDDRSVDVVVNDRGPFVKGRIIDLSYGAARRIGLDLDGVAPVEVTVLEPGTRAPTATPTPLSTPVPEPTPVSEPPPRRPSTAVEPPAGELPPTGCWWVQVGAFGEIDNARRARERLTDAGERAVVMEGPRGLERVRVGPFEDHAAAAAARERLLTDWPQAQVVPCG